MFSRARTVTATPILLALLGLLLGGPTLEVPAASAAQSLSDPLESANHPWPKLRDRLLDELATTVPPIRQDVGAYFDAAILAKDRCSRAGDKEAERQIERLRQARDYLAPMVADAEDLLTATGAPGFFRGFNDHTKGLLRTRAELIHEEFASTLESIDDQIATAEAYDPCSEPEDGLPSDDSRQASVPERGEKEKDQLQIGSTSGRPIPGGGVRIVKLPEGSNEVAEGPDDDTQEETDRIEREGTYVVQAPCHEEAVVSGDRLWTGDVTLRPKERPLVLWVPIYIPKVSSGAPTKAKLRSKEGPTQGEVLEKARELLEEKTGEDLDDYEVDFEVVETLLDPAGVWVVRVLLTPKRPPCPGLIADLGDGGGFQMGRVGGEWADPTRTDPEEGFDTLPRPGRWPRRPGPEEEPGDEPGPGGRPGSEEDSDGDSGAGSDGDSDGDSDDDSDGGYEPDPDEHEPPPVGEDDPSVDPVTPVTPPEGTIERTFDREDKRVVGSSADPFHTTDGSWRQEYPDQWGLKRIGFDAGAPGAASSLWPRQGRPVLVAVIDTGVDRTHPELADAIWTNADEVPGNGVDDDGNGYVDDVHGWNFADDSNDTRDINGHGTVTAGLIAAATGNGAGIAGVNPWAKILPIRITTWSGRSTNLRLAEAIRYAVDNGARVINLSYGGRQRTWSEYLAVAYARHRGVIVIAAAGNDGAEVDDESPAGLPGVITVAATDLDDNRLGFSNWGPGVDVAAPGIDILSLRARHTDLLRFKRDDYRPGAVIVGADRRYYRLTGTSFSAPFVAGVCSLIWSLQPELDDMQVMRKVLHSAKDVGEAGWDQFTGYGLLDARAALAADPDAYVLARLSGVAGRQTRSGTVVEVSGRARADRFRRAWIEMRPQGDDTKWRRASDDLRQPVDRGVLAAIPARRFHGASVWLLRLLVENADGARREARFELTLE